MTMIDESSENLNVTSRSAVVLFDPESGAIHHVHEVLTVDGGEPPAADELERDARKYASWTANRRQFVHPENFIVPTERLRALPVVPAELDTPAGHFLRVDVGSQALVRVPLPETRDQRDDPYGEAS